MNSRRDESAEPERTREGELEQGLDDTAESDDTVRTVADHRIQGERDIPSVNRVRSVRARVRHILMTSVAVLLGGGFLVWYYVATFQHQKDAAQKAETTRAQNAATEMKLPPLGSVDGPRAAFTDAKAGQADEGPTAIGDVLGPAPSLGSPTGPGGFVQTASVGSAPGATLPNGGPPQKTPEQLALERKLSSSVMSAAAAQPTAMSIPQADIVGGLTGRHPGDTGAGAAGGGIGSYLNPTATASASAQVLGSQRFVIPKGNFVDCTLETALDSELPGLSTCITAYDIFGADGKVVLLERGTKLVGETKGEVKQGMNRMFVLWNEARTPTGVVVNLASPGTDELGRSGLPGHADTHFWERFGAAILISIVDGAIAAGVQSESRSSNNPTVVFNPQTSRDVMTEVLRNTVAIPPTVVKNQGERIQVIVSRDVDFRGVYELRTASAR